MKAKKKAAKRVVIPKKYFDAVKTGIQFLDITLGRRVWLKRMDMSMFQLNDSNVCVAGNVWKDAYKEDDSDDGYDNFYNAMQYLNNKDPQGIRFGFYSQSEKGMQYLQDIWVRVILKMKKEARIK